MHAPWDFFAEKKTTWFVPYHLHTYYRYLGHLSLFSTESADCRFPLDRILHQALPLSYDTTSTTHLVLE